MHRLLQELHQDHVNLDRVLTLLEKQLDSLGNGGSINLHVLSEIVDYVQSYPDLIHHPREDAIFLFYRERFPNRREMIDPLLEDHQQLIAGTSELRSCMDQLHQDSPVPRDYLVSLLSSYLRRQREHLDQEEGVVYQLLEEGLASEDWDRIEARLPHGSDPLFGETMRRRYENIYDQIMACQPPPKRRYSESP